MTDYTTKLAAYKAGEFDGLLAYVKYGSSSFFAIYASERLIADSKRLAAANTVLLAAVEELRQLCDLFLRQAWVNQPDADKAELMASGVVAWEGLRDAFPILAATADLQSIVGGVRCE